MSQNSQISSFESCIKGSYKINSHYQFILSCKCGNFHELNNIFQKEHLLIFPCISFKLAQLKQTKEVHKKCSYCNKEIYIENDYCSIQKSETLFICDNCYEAKKYKNFSLSKDNFATISSIIFSKNANDDIRKRIKNKFKNFISKNNISNKNEFYTKNLSAIQLLQNFIEYL